jgi:hypothetical protein
MTLISLASKQIWPQVLSVLHTRPAELILLHSSNEAESHGPAARLADFFVRVHVLSRGEVELRQVSHDDFHALVDSMAAVAQDHDLAPENCRVNLTGGNKLMVLAAAEWCRLTSVPAFYLERDYKLFTFEPQGREFVPTNGSEIGPHLADAYEPIDLLRCQVGAAEIRDPGQRLILKARQSPLPDAEFQARLEKKFDFRQLLEWDVPEPTSREGDPLEYATAFALLKLGIPVVQRSVKLKSRVLRRTEDDEGELDLVFNWGGKLWLVDCKDKSAGSRKLEALRNEILSLIGTSELFGAAAQAPPGAGLGGQLDQTLRSIADELRYREIKTLREDLLLIGELGGLLGRAICVRKELPYPAARDFAASRRIPLVLKSKLVEELRRLLLSPGDRPASAAEHRLSSQRVSAV